GSATRWSARGALTAGGSPPSPKDQPAARATPRCLLNSAPGAVVAPGSGVVASGTETATDSGPLERPESWGSRQAGCARSRGVAGPRQPWGGTLGGSGLPPWCSRRLPGACPSQDLAG